MSEQKPAYHSQERTSMVSILDLYREVCTKQLIPTPRQKDIRTAINYLAASADTTAERLHLDAQLEATYRDQLRAYFDAHPKGQSTIRNTIQAVGQLFKAIHQLHQTPTVPIALPRVPRSTAAMRHVFEQSPYRHAAWLSGLPYSLPTDQWPAEIAAYWRDYRHAMLSTIRPRSLETRTEHMTCYIGYQSLSSATRLEKIPELSRTKLHGAKFEHDLTTITIPPALTSWDEIFDVRRLQSFMTWHAWRVQTAADAAILHRAPSKPSAVGLATIITIGLLAKHFERPETAAIYAFIDELPDPQKIHDKSAPYHRFELAEIEAVAQALMHEARRMRTNKTARHWGARQAIIFQTGLILALAWRNPMRARNWCEAILDINLKHEGERWYWHFVGDELKIREHGGRINVFEPDIAPEVVPWLQEYLERFRPRIPNAARDRHVFMAASGQPLSQATLLARLRVHVYRYTGKRLFTHLLRSLFMSHHLTAGIDINSIAYAMNDMPATVLNAYNELMEEKHRPIIHTANQQALANGSGHIWTPPNIPVTPKPPKTDPDQIPLI
jgi:hypothetical protein